LKFDNDDFDHLKDGADAAEHGAYLANARAR
jgi:hypothetical protein